MNIKLTSLRNHIFTMCVLVLLNLFALVQCRLENNIAMLFLCFTVPWLYVCGLTNRIGNGSNVYPTVYWPSLEDACSCYSICKHVACLVFSFLNKTWFLLRFLYNLKPNTIYNLSAFNAWSKCRKMSPFDLDQTLLY